MLSLREFSSHSVQFAEGLIEGVSGRASSIAIILGGSIYYTWVKHQESNQSSQKPTTSKSGQQYDRLQMEDVESGKLSRPSSYSGKPE